MEATLPKIRVTDAQNGDSSVGITDAELRTTASDGGQTARLHSNTSTESK